MCAHLTKLPSVGESTPLIGEVGSIPQSVDALISIGIPTYNRPDELRRTLNELLGQTYSNLQIIISDNASTDKRVEQVAREFSEKDCRVQYFRQSKNIGGILNFQYVLEKASGDYFMWAADDDWREPTFVEELKDCISKDNLAVVAFCNFDSRDTMGSCVPGSPVFLGALRKMRNPSAILRQVRFFLINEGTAKPHSIYGLFHRNALSEFSWPSFVDKYGWDGADVLFVFWLMSKGRLALCEKMLFGCTVGNTKHYSGGEDGWGFGRYITFFGKQLRYLYSYVMISKGVVKYLILIFLPWKVLELVKLYVILPIFNRMKNVYKKVI